MMLTPNAESPRPERTIRMKPSHLSGRSSIALPFAVSWVMAAMLAGTASGVKRGVRAGSRGPRARGALLRRVAAQDARGAGLLAGAGVAVQGAALDRLVDGLHERAVLARGGVVVAGGDRRLQTAEVGLDRRGVAPVLEALALGAQDP